MKYLLAWLSIKISSLWPTSHNLSRMRKYNAIQLGTEQLKAICAAIKSKAPCNLLVFGLGNDSAFWSILNKGGVTIFLEDDHTWFREITKRFKNIKAFPVHYDTQRKDWKTYLNDTSLLKMTLPDAVEKEKWDVILVDAPAGYTDETPGRMSSIFLSSKLIRHAGDIFVHDCEREVEDAFCNTFLKSENLKMEIQAQFGLLRHYHMTNRSI